ncbi:MAG: hypothetical protein ONB31_13810 [candidate division KSB1 bacterium]|nr:hypothetical protein [candidate division KSB1 bacterium]MDZ7336144.1 hypothetical protein [candidate division KSB1 bacterium]MDZ7357695.1 hypothetical protein [candidate division KSB1 bacterium]MDZ7401287.1 hypothetical protein [candidate division KSB1 bacterium]
MRKILLISLVTLLWALNLSAQIEPGDSEISFLGYYSTMVGADYNNGGTGIIQLSYGYFISSRLQLGIGPQVTFTPGYTSVYYSHGAEVKLSGTAFFNFNLNTNSKTIRYIFSQWYQSDFSPPSGNLTDAAFWTLGVGVRNFFTEYASINTAVSYGMSMAKNSKMGMLMIISGLSFIF